MHLVLVEVVVHTGNAFEVLVDAYYDTPVGTVRSFGSEYRQHVVRFQVRPLHRTILFVQPLLERSQSYWFEHAFAVRLVQRVELASEVLGGRTEPTPWSPLSASHGTFLSCPLSML